LKLGFKYVSETLNEVKHEGGLSFDCALSGVSMCCVLHIGNLLYAANIGTTGAVILRSMPDKDPFFYPLVTSNVAGRGDEMKRIFNSGGEVRLDVKNTPRIYCKGRVYPGIKNSKGLGNMVANVIGVTDDPDIKIYKMNSKSVDVAILLGNMELID
jgi:hypothetical protein